ncbi:hypothetical protein ACFPRL_26800 [Pseudoclavibacter helvolus]
MHGVTRELRRSTREASEQLPQELRAEQRAAQQAAIGTRVEERARGEVASGHQRRGRERGGCGGDDKRRRPGGTRDDRAPRDGARPRLRAREAARHLRVLGRRVVAVLGMRHSFVGGTNYTGNGGEVKRRRHTFSQKIVLYHSTLKPLTNINETSASSPASSPLTTDQTVR